MKNIKKLLDSEILASNKKANVINANLVKHGKSYKAFLPFKVEGEYIMKSNALEKDLAVNIEYIDNQIIINDIESELLEITAFLSKDEGTLLRAIANNIKSPFEHTPSFIIGPAGTGKTTVITEILKEAIKYNRKVLILSPTNMAVENVFERIDLSAFKDGEVVLTIKTELEDLKELSGLKIVERKLQPIKDEIDILQDVMLEMQKAKRDASPILIPLNSQDEKYTILLTNKKSDLAEVTTKLKKQQSELNLIENRIRALSSNAFIKSIASLFQSKKIDELEDDKKRISKVVKSLTEEAVVLEEEIQLYNIEKDKTKKEISIAKDEKREAEKAISKINNRLKALKKEEDSLESKNIFENAKIVGSTLMSAALNKRIQNAEFDMIILDESSMAVVPAIVVAAQALKKQVFDNVEYKGNSELYDAQNNAIQMAINSQLIIVGDPKQLPPIATTFEMKQTIFDYYGVEKIFEGHSVDNTVFLDTNFRNHPDIVELASKLFYGGMLKSGKEHDGKPSMYIRRSSSNMVLSESSYINHGNMSIVHTQIRKALERGRRSIGIITPYRKQAELISKNFEDLSIEYPDADIQAGTIHTFQGKEKDVIIYDITYSPTPSFMVPATYQGGFDSDTAKLLNVAMTRAESFLIIVGNTDEIMQLENKSLILREWTSEILNMYSQYKAAA